MKITIAGTDREVRSTKSHLVVGSGPKADVAVPGLPARGAVLRHAETEVHLTRPGKPGIVRLRVGDAVHLGGARIAVVGILPRPEAALPRADAVALFGGYDEVPVGAAAGASGAPEAPVPALEGDDEFARAVFGALKKAPFLAVSAAIHVVLLLLAILIFTEAEKPPDTGSGLLRTSLTGVEDPSAREDLGDATPLPEEPPIEAPDLTMPDLVTPEPLDVPAPSTPAPSSSTSPVNLEPLPFDPTSIHIGIEPRAIAASTRTRPKAPSVSKETLKESFGEAGANAANERAADLVRGELGAGRGGKGDLLERMRDEDILVIDGAFDHIDRVLDVLRLPYVTAPAHEDFTGSKSTDFKKHKIVFWNCGERLPSRSLQAAAKQLREFVEEGGYLFTTDWGVANVVAPAFPGYLETHGREAPLPAMVIDVEAAEGQERHPLLDGVFRPGVAGKWWLEMSSFDIVVKKPREVTVLVVSPELQEVHGRSSAVAVTFSHGRGRVLHVMGHYFQEAGNLAGTLAAQRLALNFVLQRLDQDAR